MNGMKIEDFYRENPIHEDEAERIDKSSEIDKKGVLYWVIEFIRKYGTHRGTILDYGGGSGINLDLVSNYVKFDLQVCADIRQPAKKLVGIEYVNGDSSAIERYLGERKFDVITLVEVIEHVFDPDDLITRMVRLMRPESLLIITTPNLSGLINILALILGFQPMDTEVSAQIPYGRPLSTQGVVGHIRVFTYRALFQMLSQHGLEVMDSRTIGRFVKRPQASPLISGLYFMDRAFSHMFKWGGSRMIFACRLAEK